MEGFEDERLFLRGDADASVLNFEAPGAALRVGYDSDVDAAARGGELEGVVDEVEQHLLEAYAIGDDRDRAGGFWERGDVELEFCLAGLFFERADGLFDDGHELEGLERELDSTRLELGQI